MNFGEIRFRISERTRNLGNGDFHLNVILSLQSETNLRSILRDLRNRNRSEMFRSAQHDSAFTGIAVGLQMQTETCLTRQSAGGSRKIRAS